MNQDNIWEYYQNDGCEVFSGSVTRLTWLQKELKPGQKVLNIGVGNSVFEYLSLLNNIDIYSLDPSTDSILKLKKQLNMGDKARVGYSHEIPFNNNSFDVVVMSEVLEHIADNALSRTLTEIKRVLKIHGIFMGTVPAREDLKTSYIVCPKCAHKFHKWGHVQSFNMERLTMLLSVCFKIIKVQEKIFINWKQLNWKGKVLATLKLALFNIGIHGSSENIYFCVRKY